MKTSAKKTGKVAAKKTKPLTDQGVVKKSRAVMAEPEEAAPAKFSPEVVTRKVDKVMERVANVTNPDYGCGPEMKEAVLSELIKRIKRELRKMEA